MSVSHLAGGGERSAGLLRRSGRCQPLSVDAEFELEVADRLEPFVGLRVSAVASRLGTGGKSSKSFGANTVRYALEAPSPRRAPPGFEEHGVVLRVVRVNPEFYPYENTSFPAFSYAELVNEAWKTCSL